MRLPDQTQRIGISPLSGVTITLGLCVLSWIAIRVFPYRDLPAMPKPRFLYALAPGIIVAEHFEHGWVHEFVFYLTNAMAYAVAVFCVTVLIHAIFRRA